tara:strand:+ start:656 stop:1066 length:411 start_codon:yes stop_codon:yes gene_type:complete
MNVAEKIYLMYYFLVREDKTFSKKSRTLFLVESLLFFFLTMLLFVVLGALNLRFQNILFWILVVCLIPLPLSGLIAINYYKKSGRDLEIIKKGEELYSKRQRKLLGALALLLHVVGFCLMFSGGILMSYLWSLHQN